MSVAETVLDYIQALIWPALVVLGVWVFRTQVRGLLNRIKSVEAGGAKVELSEVAEVLKDSVEETREELAKAVDPQERESVAAKLQREAAALGQVEALRGGDLEARYLRDLRHALLDYGLGDDPAGDKLYWSVVGKFDRDRNAGRSQADTLGRLGTPRSLVKMSLDASPAEIERLFD